MYIWSRSLISFQRWCYSRQAQANNIDRRPIFKSSQRGTDHLNGKALTKNAIWEQVTPIPQFIRDIQDKLRARRSMSAEQQVRLPFIMSAFFLSESPYRILSNTSSRVISVATWKSSIAIWLALTKDLYSMPPSLGIDQRPQH